MDVKRTATRVKPSFSDVMMSWLNYLKQFDGTAKINGWKSKEKAINLTVSSREEAMASTNVATVRNRRTAPENVIECLTTEEFVDGIRDEEHIALSVWLVQKHKRLRWLLYLAMKLLKKLGFVPLKYKKRQPKKIKSRINWKNWLTK